MSNKERINRIVERTSEATKRYVRKSIDVSDRISIILDQKGMTQKDLAEALGKSESQISKWLGGQHNFTVRTLASIEAALGENIVIVPGGIRQETYYPQEYLSGQLGNLIASGETTLKAELNQLDWDADRRVIKTKKISINVEISSNAPHYAEPFLEVA